MSSYPKMRAWILSCLSSLEQFIILTDSSSMCLTIPSTHLLETVFPDHYCTFSLCWRGRFTWTFLIDGYLAKFAAGGNKKLLTLACTEPLPPMCICHTQSSSPCQSGKANRTRQSGRLALFLLRPTLGQITGQETLAKRQLRKTFSHQIYGSHILDNHSALQRRSLRSFIVCKLCQSG